MAQLVASPGSEEPSAAPGPGSTGSVWGQRSVTGVALAGRRPPPQLSPRAGPATHVSSVSCRDWLRLVASLGTCSGPKLHWLSLRAEGPGGAGVRPVGTVLLPPGLPEGHGGAPEGKGLGQGLGKAKMWLLPWELPVSLGRTHRPRKCRERMTHGAPRPAVSASAGSGGNCPSPDKAGGRCGQNRVSIQV